MAKKAEQNVANAQYVVLCGHAAVAERGHDYPLVLRAALESLPLHKDAIGFQKRYLKVDEQTLPMVHRILRYSPPLFAGYALDALEKWHESGRKPERDTRPDLPERIVEARLILVRAVAMWGELCAASSELAAVEFPQSAATTTVTAIWSAMGLLALAPAAHGRTGFKLVTDLRRLARGRCAECAAERQATMVELLEPTHCQRCRKTCRFVITQRSA